jgi:uncharacterized peroxidase-related enzyme
VAHHRAGLARALRKREDLDIPSFLDAVETYGRAEATAEHPEFSDKDRALLVYAMALTIDPGQMKREHVEALRKAGCDDGEILDANQVTAYFAYANRVVDGLGVQLESHHEPS